MKKTLLVGAASLFIIGQVFAQGQTPPPSAQKSGQQTNTQNADQMKAQNQGKNVMRSGKARHAKSHKRGHRIAHRGHSRRMATTVPRQGAQTTGFGGQQMQQGFGYRGPQKLTCRKGQKPDGITCM